MSTATLAIGLLLIVSSVAARERWYLMARHGECFELEAMQRRIPELADARDPHAFAQVMKQKGHAATLKDVVAGKAIEVRVPERELGLIFAKRELCQSIERR